MTQKQRVAAGAALLDRIQPGWVERITGPMLMFSDTACVLGRVYGSFREVKHMVADQIIDPDPAKPEGQKLHEHGFYAMSATIYGYPAPEDADTKQLGLDWDAEIAARRT